MRQLSFWALASASIVLLTLIILICNREEDRDHYFSEEDDFVEYNNIHVLLSAMGLPKYNQLSGIYLLRALNEI